MNAYVVTAILVAGGLLYYFYRRGKAVNTDTAKTPDVTFETIDGVLDMAYVKAFFKTLYLDPQKHTPFVANCNAPEIKKFFANAVPSKDGYENIFLGVYNDKSDEIEVFKVIYAQALDQKLKDVMGNDPMVVLS